jgi:predicted RNA-binding protein with PIN domain
LHLFSSQLAVTSFPYPIRYILDAREMSVLLMLEKIRCQIMNRIYTKQQEVIDKWTHTICPKVKKKLDKHIEVAASCMVYPAGEGFFQSVTNMGPT